MANEQTTLIKVVVAGAIAVGPFRAGKVYAVPSDAVALLGDRFGPATLGQDEKAVPLGGEHNALIESLRTKAAAAKAAEAKAKADAPVVEKSTPAVAGSTGG